MKIIVTGDFCPVLRFEKYLEEKVSSDLLGDFQEIIDNADFAITNLECPITKSNHPITKTGPALKGGERAIEFLKKANFSAVTLANNHIMDFGIQGLSETLNTLNDFDLKFVGAKISDTSDERSFLTFKKNDFTVGVLNFAENEWSTSLDDRVGACAQNPIGNFNLIKQVKKEVDKLLVITHGGIEFYNLPSPRLKSYLRFLVDSGADAVINHHPHVVSGYEIYNKAPIFYSIGNFLFDHAFKRNQKWNWGLAVELNIIKSELDFKMITFDQFNDTSKLEMHSEKRMNKFINEINILSNLIKDDSILEEQFNKYCLETERLFKGYLEPFRNKYLLGLQNRKLFPRLFGTDQKKYLYNLVKAESHREVLLRILSNEISNSSS